MKKCTICGKEISVNKANAKCAKCEDKLRRALEARRNSNVRKVV